MAKQKQTQGIDIEDNRIKPIQKLTKIVPQAPIFLRPLCLRSLGRIRLESQTTLSTQWTLVLNIRGLELPDSHLNRGCTSDLS